MTLFYQALCPIIRDFLLLNERDNHNFIKTYVRKKGDTDLLMVIDHSKLKPAKALQDSITSILKGNQEFFLIDEQKVAYETVRKLVERAV